MNLQLNGKKALVTGSTQGIGYGIARALLSEGATVIINGITQTEVDKAIEKLSNDFPNASITGYAANFTNASEVEQLADKTLDVDILINNAGIYEQKHFTSITDADWQRMLEVNLMGAVRLSRRILPAMLQRKWGRIIFLTSEAAVSVPTNMIHYSASKAAIHAVSRGLAEMTTGTDVTVNTIMPGPTATEGIGRFLAELAKTKSISIPEAEQLFFQTERPTSILQRFASVNEVANLVTYVASPLSSATNGAALTVDGGVVRSIV